MALRIGKDTLTEVYTMLKGNQPEVGCGFLTSSLDIPVINGALQVPNIQGKYFKHDPENTLPANRAFTFSPRYQQMLDDVAKMGHRVEGMFHSQLGAIPEELAKEPYFAPHDVDMNLAGEKSPANPHYHHLIVALHLGKAPQPKSFKWDATKGLFLEEKVELV